jgi:iron complex outermembrane receptor protein
LLSPTGDTDAGSSLPISNYNQLAATFYGADAEAKNQIWKNNYGVLNLNTKADIVRAYESGSKNNLPRITPPRLTLGLDFGTDKWSLEGEVVKALRQTKTAPNETQTKSYALTNLGYTYNFIGEKSNLSTFLKVRNIFNEEARNHVSTLKDVAPMPGRNLVLGLDLTI